MSLLVFCLPLDLMLDATKVQLSGLEECFGSVNLGATPCTGNVLPIPSGKGETLSTAPSLAAGPGTGGDNFPAGFAPKGFSACNALAFPGAKSGVCAGRRCVKSLVANLALLGNACSAVHTGHSRFIPAILGTKIRAVIYLARLSMKYFGTAMALDFHASMIT